MMTRSFNVALRALGVCVYVAVSLVLPVPILHIPINLGLLEATSKRLGVPVAPFAQGLVLGSLCIALPAVPAVLFFEAMILEPIITALLSVTEVVNWFIGFASGVTVILYVLDNAMYCLYARWLDRRFC